MAGAYPSAGHAANLTAAPSLPASALIARTAPGYGVFFLHYCVRFGEFLCSHRFRTRGHERNTGNLQSPLFLLPCIAGILVCLIQVLVVANPTTGPGNCCLTISRKKQSTCFSANTGDRDKAVSGEAYRGISEASRFMGRTTDAAAFFLKSGIADNNVCTVLGGHTQCLCVRESAEGIPHADGYRLLGDLTRNPGLFSGEMSDLLADRYANDGDLRAASRLINETGVIRKWMFIGPFDNISNSGYNKAYPPESEIAFFENLSGQGREPRTMESDRQYRVHRMDIHRTSFRGP